MSRDMLLAEGVPVEWHMYPMGHSLCHPEIRDITAWLRARLELGVTDS